MSARGFAVILTTAVLCSVVACSSDGSTGRDSAAPQQDKPVIVTNFYPIQWLATELTGDEAEVVSLTPEGTEPHDLAVDANGQKALGSADVVLYLGADFQPDVQRAVAGLGPDVTTMDLLTAPGVELLSAGDIGKEALAGNKDPHVWLSPVEMIAMADAAASTITSGAPQLRGQIETALPRLHETLRSLDNDYRRGLTGCASPVLVTSHAAFGYLAHEYGLEQVAIAGVTPEDEPDPQTLRSIADVAKQRHVTTVFFEDALPKNLSQTVADEIGAQISLLSALEFDPRGSLGPDQDYGTVMRGNLNRLEKGLQCAGS
ncbi:metal ABC transporter substrate-binding protein [Mycolicibacterium setense]